MERFNTLGRNVACSRARKERSLAVCELAVVKFHRGNQFREKIKKERQSVLNGRVPLGGFQSWYNEK